MTSCEIYKVIISIFHPQANYFRATQYCRFHGMHLASITSQEENDKLEKYIKDFGKSFLPHPVRQKLISCGRSRPRAFLDFWHGSSWRRSLLLDVHRSTHNIHQLERWRTQQFPIRKRRRRKLFGVMEPWR